MDVFLIVIEDLLLVCRPPFRIVVHRFAKARQILVALALGQLGHLGGDARDFIQPNLMDVSWRSVDGGHCFHRFDIALFPVSETFDRQLGPALWTVFGAQELGEFLICRKDIVINCFCDLVGETFLVCVGKFRRKFSDADKKRLTDEITKAVNHDVFPAYKKFAEFLRTEYGQKGRPELSIESLADGKQRYVEAVKTMPTVNPPPADIQQIGLNEVARITAE